MFPWVHGFSWSAGHIIFLGLFFSVIAVVLSTVAIAMMRSLKDIKARKVEDIRWHSDFKDLPLEARHCRHDFTGELKNRLCDNEFDCRTCAMHAKVLAMLSPVSINEKDEPIFGMNIPLDRMYHRGHTWAKPEADGTFTIGVDDFGARLIGKPDRIELPPAGTTVQANGTAWHVKKQDSDVRLLSPIDGEVVATGGVEKGWYLKVKPISPQVDTRHLLRGAEVRPWMMREMERLHAVLATESLGVALADGGVPVDDFSTAYPEAEWDEVLGEMFLEP